MFMVLRPDGTKAMLFYKGIEGSELISRAWETTSGEVLFIESDHDNIENGSLISIHQNRPLHSGINLTSGIKGTFRSVFPLPSGQCLVSFRPSGTERFALYQFDPRNSLLGDMIYSNPDYHAIEAAAVVKIGRPKNLPSEVNETAETGLLFCQDINVSCIRSEDISMGIIKANKIRVSGQHGSLGEVEVEEDGSFYLKVAADTSFQIRTLDENGGLVHGPSAWIWIRPNERRGCVGCHEDPELVPVNRVPLAVKKPPVTIPVQN